jgi:hypothetical protein
MSDRALYELKNLLIGNFYTEVAKSKPKDIRRALAICKEQMMEQLSKGLTKFVFNLQHL